MADMPSIRIAHLKIMDSLSLGIFVENLKEMQTKPKSFSMECIPMNTWPLLIEGFSKGDFNAAFLPAPVAMELFSLGINIKLLLFAGSTGSTVVSNKSLGITATSDFKGKTVLFSHAFSIHHMLFSRLMASAGLKFGTKKNKKTNVFIEVVPPYLVTEMLEYDQDGDIGGCFVEEPFASEAIISGYGKQFCHSQSLWADHPGCVFVVHDYLVQDYPKAVSELIDGLIQAAKVLDQPSKNLLKTAKFFLDKEPDLIENIFSRQKNDNISPFLPDISELEIIQSYMLKEMKTMDNKIDLNKLVDLNFALKSGL